MGFKSVAGCFAEWQDATPFIFTLTEKVGSADSHRSTTIKIDLSDLREGFTDDFLLNLRELLIDWRNRVGLTTIEGYSQTLRHLLLRVIKLRLFDTKVGVIDETFLLALATAAHKMTENQLKRLKALFLLAPHSPLWAPDLHADYFPQFKDKKGAHGRTISRILAKALTRAACVHILSRCEEAYDLGEMDIRLFAFVNLAFAVYSRPESYRQIRLGDLVFDIKSNAYFLYILPVKTRVRNPQKIAYKINPALGILLQKQRQNVVEKYSHLVSTDDVDKLALFPAGKLNAEKSAWLHPYANENFGMYGTAEMFSERYPREIRRSFLSGDLNIGSNVLRHTVGTSLAQTGASAQTIQAVLKHSSNTICKAYVDIAFHGLVEVLSDALQPAFDMHVPAFTRFRSKNDVVLVEKAIRSDDLETGKVELTGECGKLIQCEYAPISCYGCARFIPCWDAEHSINLACVEQEIDDFKRRGKAFEHLLQKAQIAKYQIIMVMNAADRYRQTLHN
jgi:integrase